MTSRYIYRRPHFTAAELAAVINGHISPKPGTYTMSITPELHTKLKLLSNFQSTSMNELLEAYISRTFDRFCLRQDFCQFVNDTAESLKNREVYTQNREQLEGGERYEEDD